MNQAVAYTIDPAHSTAGFKVRHLMVSNVRGEFSAITFVSKKVAGAGGEWKVTGDLTIHGVTKEVTLDVEGLAPEAKDPWGNVKSGASAVTKISRKNFGMEFNMVLETGGVMVGDEIAITLELELLRG